MRIVRSASVIVVSMLVLTASSLQSQRPATPPSPHPTAVATTLPRGNAEHGRYLVEHVAMCIECHSGRDARGGILESERFLGAPIPFAPPWPNDWAIRAPRNRSLPGYSVEEGIRLLTQGAIARDGHQLKEPMPRFHMTPQDAADVVAYMKSLE